MDGEKRTTTPDEIVLKSKGYHTIELVLSGYESVKDVYYIDQPKKIPPIKLIPVQPSSPKKNTSNLYVMINSTPRGASIWIDEKSIGMETPSKILLDREGEHTLGLSLLGHKEYVGNISLSKPASINVTLEPNIETSTPTSIWLSIMGIIFGH